MNKGVQSAIDFRLALHLVWIGTSDTCVHVDGTSSSEVLSHYVPSFAFGGMTERCKWLHVVKQCNSYLQDVCMALPPGKSRVSRRILREQTGWHTALANSNENTPPRTSNEYKTGRLASNKWLLFTVAT